MNLHIDVIKNDVENDIVMHSRKLKHFITPFIIFYYLILKKNTGKRFHNVNIVSRTSNTALKVIR